jgi:hypothetical protein
MKFIYAMLAVAALALGCNTPSPAPTTQDAAAPPTTASVRRHLPKRSAQVAPPVPDSRSATELAQAACFGGKCKGSQVKPALAASGTTPIIPPSWTIPNWYRDIANSTGCASDTNSGTAATCTGGCSGSVCPSGIGPVKTYQEIAIHRWGTFSPRLQQATVLTGLSSDTTANDPIYWTPYHELGGYSQIQGSLGTAQQVCSTTLSAVTAKNRATPQLLNVTFASCAGAAANMLVVNSTHSSRATIYKSGSGSSWYMSQPQAPQTPPYFPLSPAPSEVDTWAIGDSVVVYQPVALNVVQYAPVQTSYNGSFDNLGFAYQFTVYDPGGAGNDDLFIGLGTTWQDVQIQRFVLWGDRVTADQNTVWINASVESGAETVITPTFQDAFGGIISGGVLSYVGNDVILAGDNALRFGDVARVYIETGGKLSSYQASTVIAESGSGPFVWGPGIFDVSIGSTQFIGTTFTASFLNTGGIQLGGQSTACSYTVATPSVINCGITINPTNLDASASSTGFGKKAFLPGGPSITNYAD